MMRISRQSSAARAFRVALLAGTVAACGGGDGGPTAPSPSGPTFAPTDLFASVTTGNDANDGSRDRPVASIARALELAEGGGRTIRIAGGTYTERVTLRSRVHLVGGYDADSWRRDTAAFVTSIRDPELAIGGWGVDSVELDGLDIATLGPSAYPALLLDWSHAIVIRGGTITALRGLDGASAEDYGQPARQGDVGLGGVSGGQGSTAGDPGAGGYVEGFYAGSAGGAGGHGNRVGGDGGKRGGGSGGAGGAGGALFASGANGKPATTSGAAGTPGVGGLAFGSWVDGYTAGRGAWGEPGKGGPGGGGGGGGGGNLVDWGGGGGGGGQGGDGGRGGAPGQNGGASIAIVLVRGSELRLVGTRVRALGGGNGGAGGAGQDGGPGGAGGKGGVAGFGTGAGGNGGAGGKGGEGGVGGSGAGGPSIGALVIDESEITPEQVRFEIMAGGRGAASETPASAGADGETADIKRLPCAC